MITVTVDGETYSIAKLDAMKQFHVARRLAPMLAALFQAIENGEDPDKATPGETIRNLFANAGPLAEALAGMTDEQVEHIIYPCMAVVKRQQGPSWADIKTPGQNKLMFADINGLTLIKLTIEVLRENFFSFFPGALVAQQESTAPRA